MSFYLGPAAPASGPFSYSGALLPLRNQRGGRDCYDNRAMTSDGLPNPAPLPQGGAFLCRAARTPMLRPDRHLSLNRLSAGKLRVLATVSRERIAQLPDVPTVAESGFGEIEADRWFGLFAPARTPMDMLARLASSFTTALHAPEIEAKLAVLGHDPAGCRQPSSS
jgi:Tripartite tricarboxylate transporter family receptor